MQRDRTFGTRILQGTGLGGEVHAPNSILLHHILDAKLTDFGNSRSGVSTKPGYPPAKRILLRTCGREDLARFVVRIAAFLIGKLAPEIDRNPLGRILRKPPVINCPLENGSDWGELSIADRLSPQPGF